MNLIYLLLFLGAFGGMITFLSLIFDFVRAFLAGLSLDTAGVIESKNTASCSKKVGLDESKTLRETHLQRLREYLVRIESSSQSYYVENKTMQFLSQVLPQYYFESNPKYYKDWIAKPDLPKSIQDFGRFVHSEIGAKVQAAKDQEVEDEKRLLAEKLRELIVRNQDRILRFLEISYRKVATVDEYGDENPAILNDEILVFLKKMSATEPAIASELNRYRRPKDPVLSNYWTPISTEISRILTGKFQEYYSLQKLKASEFDIASVTEMTGVEFEQYLINLLKRCGVTDAAGTVVTGDQGGDVLFSFKGKRVVIQAKRYSNSVGNKAIQEVHAAKGYYNCDFAWVVTNSTFTASAMSLAMRLNVVLIDGTDLSRFKSKFKEYFQRTKAAA